MFLDIMGVSGVCQDAKGFVALDRAVAKKKMKTSCGHIAFS